MTDIARLIVSDRAVLHFLQHNHDIDVEGIRAKIGEHCQRGAEANAPVVRVEQARFVLRGHIVIGCCPEGRHVGYKTMSDLMRQAQEMAK